MTISSPIATQRFYQPELDALRFVAFLGVCIHHKSSPVQLLPMLPHSFLIERFVWSFHVAGAFGVHLFFLLSSYLITRLLRREVEATGKLNLRAFYIRRSLRIWPLYFFFLGLCLILQKIGYATDIPHGFYLSSSFFVANWYLLHHGYIWMPAVPLWTISVEEQFYLTWPWLMGRGSEKIIRIVSITCIAISQLTLFYPGLHGVRDDSQISFNTLTQIQFFGLGALLALWVEKHPAAMKRRTRIGAFLLGCVLYFVAAMFDPRSHSFHASLFNLNFVFACSAVASLLLFRAFLGADARYFPKWLIFLGKISFGLYIFDFLSGYLARTICRGRVHIFYELPLTLLLDIAMAMTTWFLLERPFLRIKSRFEVVQSRVAG